MSERESAGLRGTLTPRLAATTLLAMLVGVAAGALFWVFSEVVALASLFVLAGALMGTVGLGVWLDSHEPHRRGSVAIMFLGAVLGGYLVLLAELIATEITSPRPDHDRAGVVAAFLGLGLAFAGPFSIAYRVTGYGLLGAVTWILIASALLLALFAALFDPQ